MARWNFQRLVDLKQCEVGNYHTHVYTLTLFWCIIIFTYENCSSLLDLTLLLAQPLPLHLLPRQVIQVIITCMYTHMHTLPHLGLYSITSALADIHIAVVLLVSEVELC